MAGSDQLMQALSVIGQIPQTQADVRQLAAAAQAAQSPETKAALEEARSQLTKVVYIHLGLSAATALFTLGVLMVLLGRMGHPQPQKGGR